MWPCGTKPMRAPRLMFTGVPAFRPRPWAHLPPSPGTTVRLANRRRFIDRSESRRQAKDPDRYRPGLNAQMTALKEVGLETIFPQPDFFYGVSRFVSETIATAAVRARQ